MSPRSVILAMSLWMTLVAGAHAERIILTNGDRIEGRIVDERPDYIVVRRWFQNSEIIYHQRIARSAIARIEESDAPVPPPVIEGATAAEDESGEPPPRPLSGRRELLESALDNWESENYGTAALQLTRLINNASSLELQVYEREVERRLEMSLADLAAEARWRAAHADGHRRPVRFSHVTRYERDALIARLVLAYEYAISEPVSAADDQGGRAAVKPTRETLRSRLLGDRGSTAQAAPVSSQVPGERALEEAEEPGPLAASADQPAPEELPVEPDVRGHTIRAWAENPESFDGTPEEAKAFADQVRYALSLLKERIRIDAEFRTNPAMRSELRQDRVVLHKLLEVATARTGGALTPEERAEMIADLRRLQERYHAELERRHIELGAHFRDLYERTGVAPSIDGQIWPPPVQPVPEGPPAPLFTPSPTHEADHEPAEVPDGEDS